jgi:hypothetical protein
MYKPRARPVTIDMSHVNGPTFQGWRVHHPQWGVGYHGRTLDEALDVALRMRMFRLTLPR